jgi:hypothetical protein
MLFLLEPSHQETSLSSSSQSQDHISVLQLSGHGLVKHKMLEHLRDHHHCTLWQSFVVTAESCCMLLYYAVFHLDPVSANRETWYSSIKVTLFLQPQRGRIFGHSLHWIYWGVGILEAWVGQITCCKIQDSTSLWQILLMSLLVFLCDIAVTKCVDISWISVMFFYFCIMIWSQIGPVLIADSDNSLTGFFWNGFLHNGLFTVKGWRDNVMHV